MKGKAHSCEAKKPQEWKDALPQKKNPSDLPHCSGQLGKNTSPRGPVSGDRVVQCGACPSVAPEHE